MVRILGGSVREQLRKSEEVRPKFWTEFRLETANAGLGIADLVIQPLFLVQDRCPYPATTDNKRILAHGDAADSGPLAAYTDLDIPDFRPAAGA